MKANVPLTTVSQVMKRKHRCTEKRNGYVPRSFGGGAGGESERRVSALIWELSDALLPSLPWSITITSSCSPDCDPSPDVDVHDGFLSTTMLLLTAPSFLFADPEFAVVTPYPVAFPDGVCIFVFPNGRKLRKFRREWNPVLVDVIGGVD